MANDSVTDSECIKAAQDVEQLDRELDELVKVLAEIDNDSTTKTTSTTASSQPSTYRTVDFDSLAAWLEGLSDTTLPDMTNAATNPQPPSNFESLVTKPIEQSWLDERAMSSFDYVAARAQWGGSHPSSAITISSDGSSASPLTISSDGTSARAVGNLTSILAPALQPAALSTSSFKTPERPTMPASTQAPKKQSKRHYSRWSMAHLQDEFLCRFQPLSQKRTLDRQFMVDALQHDDMAKKAPTSTACDQPLKKQRVSK
jgi:hypothetical protein